MEKISTSGTTMHVWGLATRAWRLMAVLAMGGVAAFGLTARSAAATTPACGTETETGEARRASVAGTPPEVTIELGRRPDGRREREMFFTFSGDCTPAATPADASTCASPGRTEGAGASSTENAVTTNASPAKTDGSSTAIPVRTGIFAGEFEDLVDRGALCTTTKVDGELVTVVLGVDRNKVPAGKYTGSVTVGNAQTGSGKVQVTITRQEPLFWWPLILGASAIFGGTLVAALRNLADRRESTTGLVARKVQSTQGKRTQRIWSVIKRLSEALSRVTTAKNAWAAFAGLGAGTGAFLTAYAANRSWTLNLENGIALLGTVGGATLAASFAVWGGGRNTREQ